MGKESAERKSILVKKSSSLERALLFVTLSEICKLFSLYLSNFAIFGFAITVCANDVCTEGRPSVLLSWYFWPGHQFLPRASVRLGYRGKMQKGVLIPISASSSSPPQQSPSKTVAADAIGSTEGWRRGEKEAG